MFSDSYVDLLLWDLCYLFDCVFDYIHMAIILWKLLLPRLYKQTIVGC